MRSFVLGGEVGGVWVRKEPPQRGNTLFAWVRASVLCFLCVCVCMCEVCDATGRSRGDVEVEMTWR